jgi:hypothetical protein
MSILKPKVVYKTMPFSVRLPVELITEIDRIKADAEAAGLMFDAQEIVHKALVAATKSAAAELAKTADSQQA